MTVRINTFDDDSMRKIAESVRRLELQVRNLQDSLEAYQFSASPAEDCVICKPDEALPAYTKSSKTPGIGDCKIWRRIAGALSESTRTIKVDNYRGVKIKTDFIVARRHFQTGKWIVSELLYATHCNALLKGAFTSGGSSVTVDNVTPLDGISPVSSASDELTATVIFPNWPAADDNAVCKIEWNGEEERWEVYQIDCQG